ncbi:helix-turn-helix domain-containing protein [Spirosoma profusum]|uniref:helix-turn-helix domain-containing protein n=1 Tax=Spirosoma profusum TaxID=2771354 RepID=UPI001CC25871|nr:helix-turn-helix transcriptional regulator [Spirosoma profusum]
MTKEFNFTPNGTLLLVSNPTQHTGQMIKEARKKAGLTQKELAEKMGITVSAVTKMETRKVGHSVETLERVAMAIGKQLQINFV